MFEWKSRGLWFPSNTIVNVTDCQVTGRWYTFPLAPSSSSCSLTLKKRCYVPPFSVITVWRLYLHFCEEPVKLTHFWSFIRPIPHIIYCFMLLPSELATPAFLLEQSGWIAICPYSLFVRRVKSVMPKTLKRFLFSGFPHRFSESERRAIHRNTYNL
jgi:hypothetical protein